jgi:hypothetical protein
MRAIQMMLFVNSAHRRPSEKVALEPMERTIERVVEMKVECLMEKLKERATVWL